MKLSVLGVIAALPLIFAGCAPPVVEDLRFQNVPLSNKLSAQISNGGQPLSVSPTFKVVNGIISMNNGQTGSSSPSFKMTGGITYVPAQ